MILFRSLLFLFVSSAALCGADARKPSPPPVSPPASPPSRRVVMGPTDVVSVRAKVDYTTMFLLPPSEEIIEATCGNKENWIVNGFQHLAYVKPVREGSRSNLNLLTKAGNVYSFVLTEISAEGGEPDLKLFIEPKEDFPKGKAVRFVSAEELDASRRELQTAKQKAAEEERQLKEESEREVRRFRSEYPLRLEFYSIRTEGIRPPYKVKAIFTDGMFTYIKTTPGTTVFVREWASSEYIDVICEQKGDLFIAPGVLPSGYVSTGKKHIYRFER